MKLTKAAIAEVKALEDKKGKLTPEQIVKAAENPKSALHRCFEWDDAKAAHCFRVEQAREILVRIKIDVEYEDGAVRVVSYVRDPDKSYREQGYASVSRISRPDAATMMRQELERISALFERAIALAKAKASDLPRGLVKKLIKIKAAVDTTL